MKLMCKLKQFDTNAVDDQCMSSDSNDWNGILKCMKQSFSECTRSEQKAVIPMTMSDDNSLTIKEIPIANDQAMQNDLAEALLAYGKDKTHTSNASIFRKAMFDAADKAEQWNNECDQETYKLLYYLENNGEDGIIPLCVLKRRNDSGQPLLELFYINTEG